MYKREESINQSIMSASSQKVLCTSVSGVAVILDYLECDELHGVRLDVGRDRIASCTCQIQN